MTSHRRGVASVISDAPEEDGEKGDHETRDTHAKKETTQEKKAGMDGSEVQDAPGKDQTSSSSSSSSARALDVPVPPPVVESASTPPRLPAQGRRGRKRGVAALEQEGEGAAEAARPTRKLRGASQSVEGLETQPAAATAAAAAAAPEETSPAGVQPEESAKGEHEEKTEGRKRKSQAIPKTNKTCCVHVFSSLEDGGFTHMCMMSVWPCVCLFVCSLLTSSLS
jgi:hypothetical protein